MTTHGLIGTPIPKNASVLPNLRLAVAMWLAGMLGVVAVVLQVLPLLTAGRTLPLTGSELSALTFIQGGVTLALAVWVGAVLAPRVGLRAPAFEAFSTRASVLHALRPQWRPGVLGGLAGGAVLIALSGLTPPQLLAAAPDAPLPLASRLLYGGVTEELLLRWGFMTLLVWGLWRIVQRNSLRPSALLVWTAIIGSAVLFGVAHLPVANAMIGSLDAPVVLYIVGGNAAFGIIAGLLYWRAGLEAAMLAHGVAHLVVVAFATFSG